MPFKLSLPKFKRGSESSGDQTVTIQSLPDAMIAPAKGPDTVGFGFLAKYPVTRQLQMLGLTLVLLMVVIAGLVFQDNRASAYNTAYVATAGELRMLSQRLAKASSLALQGDPFAFMLLRDSHGKFAFNMDRLKNGGETVWPHRSTFPGASCPAASQSGTPTGR